MKKKVLCTALAVTMLLTTTASATAKPWWLSKYRVTFDNELGIVGNVTLTFASDGGSFIRPIIKRYGESISLESYIPTKYGYTFKGWFTDPRTKQNQVTTFKFTKSDVLYAKWQPNPQEPVNPNDEIMAKDTCKEFINQKSSAESRKELSAKSAELGRPKKRKNELESLFKRLYEDNVLGRITDDQFHMLSGSYTTEQKDVDLRIPELEDEIEALKSATTNTDKFIALAKKYIHIKELTPEVLLTFVSKIVIHERSEKRSKSATQQIDIYFTHIGNAYAI